MEADVSGQLARQSRRKFFKTTAAGSVAGAWVVQPRWIHAAGNDAPIKVALIGCGARGSGAAAQAMATGMNVRLWAMADAFNDRIEDSLKALQVGAAGNYNLGKGDGFGKLIDVPPERRFVGLDAYRKAIDCGADVVILTGPPAYRPLHFEYAVGAGKHVFMEKPLATDSSGVRRVLAAAAIAREKNLKVGVGLQRHHDANYVEAIQRIQDGAIGRIVTLRVYWNGGPPAKQPVPRGAMTELEYQVRNWYFFNWLSGDHICEQHIHNLDVGNWIKRAHPVMAEGLGGRQVRVGKEYGNIFDHHSVEYTFEDGVKMFSSCRQMAGCKNRVAEFVEGTDGEAELGTGRPFLKAKGQVIWQPARKRPGGAISPYQVEHNVLFSAIVDNRPHNEAEQGALSTMTAILGRMATYSGQQITWDQAFHSSKVLTSDAERWDAPAPVLPLADGGYEIAVPGLTKVV
jgi:myo-inositol 2-dehydrogenase / D-chiro-inositol 1-dehydrogenase